LKNLSGRQWIATQSAKALWCSNIHPPEAPSRFHRKARFSLKAMVLVATDLDAVGERAFFKDFPVRNAVAPAKAGACGKRH
jgi:hypothetical protein